MTAIQKKADSWYAHLKLQYEQCGRSTVLAKRNHSGPLMVQRPFYPEGGVCHSYILHPPGGVVGGDSLHIDVQVDNNAHALLTTPASGKFYNSHKRTAQLQQTLRIGENASLEWLPQDNIFFEGSHTSLKTHIELSLNARFIGWEISCLGRPFSGTLFDSGNCDQKIILMQGGLPLLVDHTRLQAGHEVLTEKWGLSACTVTGTLIATPADKMLVERLRAEFEHSDEFVFSVTLMNGVLLCRFLGHHGETARLVFERAWKTIRPRVIGPEACSPRIWKT